MNRKLNSLKKKKPIEARVSIESESEDRIAIMLNGDISSSAYYGYGISLDSVVEALAGKSADVMDVYINTYGGDMFEAIAIKNYLIRRPERIVTHIDGIAASGGSIIAMAGEEIIMPKDSEMMIHNPWTIGYGNADDFRKLADELDTANVSVQETYMGHFTGTREELIELLEAETWLTADEALSYGLATSVGGEVSEPDEDEGKETIENKSNKTNLKGTQKVAFLNL